MGGPKLKIDYSFLDFYYKLGGTVIPLYRDKNRAPAIKWKTKQLTRKALIEGFPITKYNYAWLIPPGYAIIDVEATKGGLEDLKKLKKKGFNLKAGYHNITGREGIHAIFKNKKEKLPHGYSNNYKGIEFLSAGKLVTIPPSIHHLTNKSYRVGSVKPRLKNIPVLSIKHLKLFTYSDKTSPETDKKDLETSADKKLSGKQGVLQAKIDELIFYLSYINVKDYSEFTRWIKLLFSAYDLVQGDQRGYEVFLNWSLKDNRYKKDIGKIKIYWQSVKKIKRNLKDKQSLITWKTVAYIAAKNGAKLKIGYGRLVDEVINLNFKFISTIENDGEYTIFTGDGDDIFINSPKEIISGEKWTRLTDGVLSRIMGFIFDETGILKSDFTTMRVKDLLERNKVSIFSTCWKSIEDKYFKKITQISQLKTIRTIYFDCLKHVDKDHAEAVYPYFVRYLTSAVKSNMSEYDELYRSNAQTCLCISSEQQGFGKSTFVKLLTPMPEMIYFPNLKTVKDMETKLAVARASMCIIDDYQPTYQKELNNLNELITQHKILVRPKYGRTEISKTRRAYFALTTNLKKIHNDFTGTRRWINLDLKGIDIERIIKLAPKLHGEMASLARSGFRHWFTIDEIKELEKLNEPFSGSDNIDNILINHYEPSEDNLDLEVPLIEIMRKVNRAYGNNMVKDVRQLGAAVSRLFPNAKSRRAIFEKRKITVYNLRQIKAFDERDFVMNDNEVTAS